MIGQAIGPILIATGAVTMVPSLQFFFPRPMLARTSKLVIDDEAGLFFARHWGLCTLTVGLLLVYAGLHAEGRGAIVGAILVEKLGFVGLVLANWKRFPGLRGAGLFDAACCVLYSLFLLGA